MMWPNGGSRVRGNDLVGGARDGAYGQVRYATTFGSVMAGLGPATPRTAPPLRFHVWLGPRVKPGDDGAEGSG